MGGTNGKLYLFTTGLSPAYQYDGRLDGRPINTTPMADANGEWYFGASDGYVYDVEIPMGGTQMFKAARFGPGGADRQLTDRWSLRGGPVHVFWIVHSRQLLRADWFYPRFRPTCLS